MSEPLGPSRRDADTPPRDDTVAYRDDAAAYRDDAAAHREDIAAYRDDPTAERRAGPIDHEAASRDPQTERLYRDDVVGPDAADRQHVGSVPPASAVPPPAAAPTVPDGRATLAEQREAFGGMKIGSAFFGWLAATGTAVILLALLTAAGVGFGYATSDTMDQAVVEAENATGTARTVGLVGAILLLVVLFIAYFAGGYVAGRMARFNGGKQGLAVWLWGIVMALIIAALTWIAGAQYNIFAGLNLPRLPVDEGQVTLTAVISIVAALAAALLGAILGGLAGMRFHRRVDRVAFGR